MSDRREVWITGVGLLTCLGEGIDTNWQKLEAGGTPPYDDKMYPPYIVHPLPAMSFDKQIPKKGVPDSRAYCAAMTMPPVPREPNPPGTRIPDAPWSREGPLASSSSDSTQRRTSFTPFASAP